MPEASSTYQVSSNLIQKNYVQMSQTETREQLDRLISYLVLSSYNELRISSKVRDRGAARIFEDRVTDKATQLSHFLEFALSLQKLAAAASPDDETLTAYHRALGRLFAGRTGLLRSLSSKREIIEHTRISLKHPGFSVCDYCGKYFQNPKGGNSCSEHCKKGLLNRADYETRHSSHDEATE